MPDRHRPRAGTGPDGADVAPLCANAAIKDAGVAESGPVRFLVGDAAEAAMRTELLAGDLRAAITRGQIDILFQPQVAIATGRIEGVEALARWNHPRHGEIGAATLFAVAEQSDHMIELSRHVHKGVAWPPNGRKRSAICACPSM